MVVRARVGDTLATALAVASSTHDLVSVSALAMTDDRDVSPRAWRVGDGDAAGAGASATGSDCALPRGEAMAALTASETQVLAR